MQPTVTVEIPGGEFCTTGKKLCVFARYTKKWDAYNCTIHHRILKGEKAPRKCVECLEHCKGKGGTGL